MFDPLEDSHYRMHLGVRLAESALLVSAIVAYELLPFLKIFRDDNFSIAVQCEFSAYLRTLRNTSTVVTLAPRTVRTPALSLSRP